MKETELKSQVEDYLDYKMNQGELYWDRLNSGDFIEVRGNTRRRIKGCRKGTADLFILMYGWILPRTIFVELKGEKGRASPEQGAFGKMVEGLGAEHCIVRSLEELEEALK